MQFKLIYIHLYDKFKNIVKRINLFNTISWDGSRFLIYVGLNFQRNNNENYIKNKITLFDTIHYNENELQDGHLIELK